MLFIDFLEYVIENLTNFAKNRLDKDFIADFFA